MAVVKIFLFDSPSRLRKDGTYPVCLKITHKRKRKNISLGRNCEQNQWNKEAGRFKKNFPDYKVENQILLKFESIANDILRDFEKDDIPFSFDEFEAKFLKKEDNQLLVEYFQIWIDRLYEEGKVGTASSYKTTINSIKEFCKSTKRYKPKSLNLSDIGHKFLIDFEHWLRAKRSTKDTTISVYMRALRAVLNKAKSEKIVPSNFSPFQEYKIAKRLKTDTQKRAISKDNIRLVEELELEENSDLQFAKDIFLFSYYMRGINFVDIAHLKPANVHEGRLMYIRKKTGKPFNIKIQSKANTILDYYRNDKYNASQYIFPIFDDRIHKTEKQKYNRRKGMLRKVNKNLKIIAEMIDQPNLKLTTYVSRHTYATVLKKAGTSISLISEAMGHQTEKVTQTYLKAFENEDLDQIDQNIL